MPISIEEISAHNRHDLHRCDNTFTVDAKLVLRVEDDVPHLTVVSVPPYTKQYPRGDTGAQNDLAQLDKGIYFAYVDGKLAGQIVLFKNWNGYAYLDDIAVDRAFRRQGIGRALIDQAVAWAKARRLPGIMLETQNINVAACRLYERCGFVLVGYDRFLYRGLDPASEEIALYWYLVF